MRLQPLFFICLLTTCPAFAVTFQTRLENVEWRAEGDQFECRLSQSITNFGSGEFVRKAGEQVTFRLRAPGSLIQAGVATLIAAAAPWQPGRGDINLGTVATKGGEVPLSTSQLQAGKLLSGLLEGRSPVIRPTVSAGAGPLEIRMLPAKFSKAYSDYQACSALLLPMNFDQVKQSEIGFPGGGIALDEQAKSHLKNLIVLLKADPSINRIQLDGHSDNSGSRLTNRDLSRRRALAVMEFLKTNGIPEQEVSLRFHGESYPLAPNTNETNRARNRRVSIHLERGMPNEKSGTSTAKLDSSKAS